MGENKRVKKGMRRRRANDFWQRFLNGEILGGLFDKKMLFDIDFALLFSKYVEVVNIETSTFCNRRCEYCPLSNNDRGSAKKFMDKEIFLKILQELKSIDYNQSISLNLYNEPLASDNIYERISQVREYLPHAYIIFNSNGDYVNKEVLQRLSDCGLNALSISLHANKEYRDKDRQKAIFRFFTKIQLDYEVTNFAENKNITVIKKIHDSFELKVMTNNWSEYGNDRAGSAIVNFKSNRIHPCMKPIREFTISCDGVVVPCCNFFPDSQIARKYNVGNIVDRTLFQLYNSEIMIFFRRGLFSFSDKFEPCNHCNDLDNALVDTQEDRMKILNTKEQINKKKLL